MAENIKGMDLLLKNFIDGKNPSDMNQLNNQEKYKKFKGLTEPSLLDETGPMSAGFLDSMKAGVQVNPKDAVTSLSKTMGLPEESFIIDDSGEIFYEDPKDGKYYKAVGSKPGYYTPDFAHLGVDAVGSGLLSLKGPFALATVPAYNMTTETLRQELAENIRGEEGSYDKLRIGISGVGGVAGEGISKAIKTSKIARQAKDFEGLDVKDMQRLIKNSKDFDIDLTAPEAANLMSLLNKQGVVGGLDDTATRMTSFYANRRGQVQDAVTKYLDEISPSRNAIETGIRVKDSVTKKQLELKQNRANVTKPLYDDAVRVANENDTLPMDIRILVDDLDKMIKNQVGKNKTALENVKENFFLKGTDGKKILGADGKPTLIDDAEILQNIISDISTQTKAANVPGSSLQGVDARVVGNLKKFQKQIKNTLSFDNPAYKEADKVYGELSKEINKLDKSFVNKIIKTADGNEDTIGNIIFKGNEENIKYAKDLIPQDEWKAITSSWLGDTFEKAIKQNPGATQPNFDIGLKWANTITGNKRQLKAIEAALEPEQYKTLIKLTDVLKASGRAPKKGSDTAFKTQNIEDLKSNTISQVSSVVDTRPVVGLRGFLDRRALGINANKFVDIILDPNGFSKLKEIQNIKDTSLRNSALAQLFFQGTQESIDDDIPTSQRRLEKEQNETSTKESNDAVGANKLLQEFLK